MLLTNIINLSADPFWRRACESLVVYILLTVFYKYILLSVFYYYYIRIEKQGARELSQNPCGSVWIRLDPCGSLWIRVFPFGSVWIRVPICVGGPRGRFLSTNVRPDRTSCTRVHEHGGPPPPPPPPRNRSISHVFHYAFSGGRRAGRSPLNNNSVAKHVTSQMK